MPLPHRPTYQWFRDGNPLSDGQSNHTVSSKERNLTLRPASPEHSGLYSCCAHNAFGQACSSQNFTLSIAGEPDVGMEEARREWEGAYHLPAHPPCFPLPQMKALPGWCWHPRTLLWQRTRRLCSIVSSQPSHPQTCSGSLRMRLPSLTAVGKSLAGEPPSTEVQVVYCICVFS
jgi:hypothetical protein